MTTATSESAHNEKRIDLDRIINQFVVNSQIFSSHI